MTGWPDLARPSVPLNSERATHEVKCWPAYFHALADGRKAFELRRDDRPYRAGDDFHVREWCPVRKDYTGRELRFTISYVLRKHPEFGLEDGFAILSFTPADLAAERAAAWCAGRDAAAAHTRTLTPTQPYDNLIRALQPPTGTDALAAMLAQAEARAMKRAAEILRARHRGLEHIREYAEAQHAADEIDAATIRAAMKKEDEE